MARAQRLMRDAGIDADILVLGPVNRAEAALASDLDLAVTVASLPACRAAVDCGKPLRVHLKVETGVNRQGLTEAEIGQAMAVAADSARSMFQAEYAEITLFTGDAHATLEILDIGQRVIRQ